MTAGSGGVSTSTTAGAGAAGGTSGTAGGTGGSSGATGGTGGSSTPPTGGGAASGATQPLPMDGNQLAVCRSAVECNIGLTCYTTFAASRGFCTKVCATNNDCTGLTGGTYTCLPGQGVCVIECSGTNDTSCPAQMACVDTGGGFGFPAGGTGGASAMDDAGASAGSFHCTYPQGAGVEKQPAWNKCTMLNSVDCETGLVCSEIISPTLSGIGHCTQTCMTNTDCSARPSSGTIDPTCAMVGGFGGPGGGTPQMRCVLDCSMRPDGCPTGMTCAQSGGGGGPMRMRQQTSRCEYAQ
jgi:hypothetical protein